MYRVEILHPSNGKWLDHAENEIYKLVLDKKYEPIYTPGHYQIDSFGELDRTLGNIPENPIQSLSDWTITIPAVYSDSSGFSTIDLLYHLECINEERGKEFDLIGCGTVLYDDDDIIFKGVVNSISTSGTKSSINISERMGNPTIEKSELPVVLGASLDSFLPVKITKDSFGNNEIILSDNMLMTREPLYIYSKKLDRYIEATPQQVTYVNGLRKIIFVNNYDNDNDIAKTTGVYQAGSPIEIPENIFKQLLKDNEGKDLPINYIIIDKENQEETKVQLWTKQSCNLPPNIPADTKFQLGGSHNGISTDSPIRRMIEAKAEENYVDIELEDTPISMAETYDNSADAEQQIPKIIITRIQSSYMRRLNDGRSIYEPVISGNPDSLLRKSREPEFDANDYPIICPYNPIPIDSLDHIPIENIAKFTFKFSDIDLPSGATVTEFYCQLLIEFSNDNFDNRNGKKFAIYIEIGDITEEVSISFPENTSSDTKTSSFDKIKIYDSSNNPEFSETQTIHLYIIFLNVMPKENGERWLKLKGFKIHRKVKIPFNDIEQFYIQNIHRPSDAANLKYYFDSALIDILAKVNMKDYYANSGNSNTEEIEYGFLLNNETAKLRDKLKTLAVAAAKVIKHDFAKDNFTVSSISRKHEIECYEIPKDCVLLENNMFSFKMQTPMRNNIYTGIEISWGKSVVTGKYQHKLTINNMGMYRDWDTASVQPKDYECKDLEWGGIFEQLNKNTQNYSNIKAIENEWIINWKGAENMAYNYLTWSCAPLRKAQIVCITKLLRDTLQNVDIGSFVNLDLPGYPEKLKRTAWVITGKTDDLDSYLSNLELLEVWNIPIIPAERYLLTEEDSVPFITEDTEEGIKLER